MSTSKKALRTEIKDNEVFFNGFCDLEPPINNSEEIPSTNSNYSVRSTFCASCVVINSRVVVILSVIFALLESIIFGLLLVSLYGLRGMFVNGAFFFLVLIVGEIYRIPCSVKWWLYSTQQNVDDAYEMSITWIKNMTCFVVFFIFPIWLLSICMAFPPAGRHGGSTPASSIIFAWIVGVDLFVFIPFFVCPTAIFAAIFWKRRVKDTERLDYIREVDV